jgi:outer membrane immunogenic protein
MKFKTKLLIAAGAMVLAGAASAQAHNWNGYYAGFNLGAQKGKADVATAFDYVDGYDGGLFSQPAVGEIAAAGAGSSSRTRFHTGVTFGYNAVSGSQLMGYELDLSFLELRLKRTVSAPFDCCNMMELDQRVRAHHLVTARGRWGMLSGNSLFYVTGGLAASRLSGYAAFADAYGLTTDTGTKKIKLGWTLGAGYEQPMSNGWTFKTEYLHVNFNSVGSSSRNLSIDDVLFSNTMSNKADVKLDILRVGFNKKF